MTTDKLGMVSTKKKKKGRKTEEENSEEDIANAHMMEDPTASFGIGNFRHGIVTCKVSEIYWTCKPFKTLDSAEVYGAYREFCGQMLITDIKAIATLTVYCDAHGSLQNVCTDSGMCVTSHVAQHIVWPR